MRGTPRLAKLSAPRPERVLARPRLDRLLDSARRHHRVVWLAGPPGSGKTTLVASWLRRRRLGHAWLQLDESDSDVGSFFHYLGASIRAHRPGLELPEFTGPSAASPARFARLLVRALTVPRTPAAIVLDDYHLLRAGSLVHGAMAAMAAELPPRSSFVVMSRGGPPPALARATVTGELVEVPKEALRFTRRETGAVAALRGQGNASASRVRAVHDRTEGWAAGTVLLLSRRSGDGGAAGLPEREDLIGDYLEEEVLRHAGPEARRILAECAVLPRIDADVARELTGSASAGELLASFARRWGFIGRIGDAFQFHALFRDLLLGRGSPGLASPGRRDGVRRAASRLARRGQAEDAFRLLVTSEDWDEALRLVETEAPALLLSGRAESVVEWVTALPEAKVRGSPRVMLHLGEAQAWLRPREAVATISAAYDQFAREGDARGASLAWAALVETLVYFVRDLPALDPWLSELGLLRRQAALAGPGARERLVGAAFAALTHRQPWHPDLPWWEEEAMTIALSPGDDALRLRVGAALALYYGGWAIDLARARLLVDALAPVARAQRGDPSSIVTLRLGEAIMEAHRHRLDAAREAARAALSLSTDTGLGAWDGYLHQAIVLADLMGGDLRAPSTALDQLAAHRGASASELESALFHHTATVVALRHGDVAAAREHAGAGSRLVSRSGSPHMQAIYGVAFALGGEQAHAWRALEAVVELARRCGARLAEAGAALGLTLLARRAGDAARAAAWLEAGFAAGRSLGVLGYAWYGPQELSEICATALERGIEPEYAAELIRVQGLSPVDGALLSEAWPRAVSVRVLGDLSIEVRDRPLREGRKAQRRPLDLLRLLAAAGPKGLSEVMLGESLWPDADGDAAQRSLETTVYRLRRLLGAPAAVLHRHRRVALDPLHVFVDAWVVRHLVDLAGSARPDQRASAEWDRWKGRVESLYRGDLCADAPELPGLRELRERLRRALRDAFPGLAP